MQAPTPHDGAECATEGCSNKALPRSALCPACLKWRRRHPEGGDRPMRPYRRDPVATVIQAAERVLAAAEARASQLSAASVEVRGLLKAVRGLQEAADRSDAEWRQAQDALHQALSRYVQRTQQKKAEKIP